MTLIQNLSIFTIICTLVFGCQSTDSIKNPTNLTAPSTEDVVPGFKNTATDSAILANRVKEYFDQNNFGFSVLPSSSQPGPPPIAGIQLSPASTPSMDSIKEILRLSDDNSHYDESAIVTEILGANDQSNCRKIIDSLNHIYSERIAQYLSYSQLANQDSSPQVLVLPGNDQFLKQIQLQPQEGRTAEITVGLGGDEERTLFSVKTIEPNGSSIFSEISALNHVEKSIVTIGNHLQEPLFINVHSKIIGGYLPRLK
ncbi:MAG: hypothetical protein NT027_13980, partial [Proteobacteria bacterium]|nr:hypothetical protein [Pseudomonadota bacterium]